VLGPEHPDTLRSMNNLAVVYDDQGKYAQAEALYSQTLEIQRRVLPGPTSINLERLW
jgi:Tfp pilus assembly protein PilF